MALSPDIKPSRVEVQGTEPSATLPPSWDREQIWRMQHMRPSTESAQTGLEPVTELKQGEKQVRTSLGLPTDESQDVPNDGVESSRPAIPMGKSWDIDAIHRELFPPHDH